MMQKEKKNYKDYNIQNKFIFLNLKAKKNRIENLDEVK